MIFFFSQIFLILFTLNLCVDKKKFSLNTKYYLTSFFLIILLGFRGVNVGVDTYAYYDMYYLINNATNYNEIEWLEPGYIFSSKLFGYLNLNASIYILIISAFTIFNFTYFFKSRSSDFGISVLIFLALGGYFFLFNGLRQGIAASILVLSISYIVNKNLLKYTICVLLAASFHYSALVFYPFYFILRIYFKKGFFIQLWVLSLVSLFFPEITLEIIGVLKFLLSDYYYKYFDWIDGFNSEGITLRLLINQIIFLFLLYSYNKNNNSHNNLIITLSIYYILIDTFLYNMGYIARIGIYFSYFIPVAIPIAVNNIGIYNKYKFYFNTSLYIILIIIFFRALLLGTNGILPYEFFFNIK